MKEEYAALGKNQAKPQGTSREACPGHNSEWKHEKKNADGTAQDNRHCVNTSMLLT